MINKSYTDDQNIILDFVRGLKHWNELSRIGLEISFENNQCQISGEHRLIVEPDITDIGQGFSRFSEGGSMLQEWAAVVLAASSAIDFTNIENHPDGEYIIEILWRLAYNESVSSEEVRNLAERLNK